MHIAENGLEALKSLLAGYAKRKCLFFCSDKYLIPIPGKMCPLFRNLMGVSFFLFFFFFFVPFFKALKVSGKAEFKEILSRGEVCWRQISIMKLTKGNVVYKLFQRLANG